MEKRIRSCYAAATEEEKPIETKHFMITITIRGDCARLTYFSSILSINSQPTEGDAKRMQK